MGKDISETRHERPPAQAARYMAGLEDWELCAHLTQGTYKNMSASYRQALMDEAAMRIKDRGRRRS
jgi:hypothetical protein